MQILVTEENVPFFEALASPVRVQIIHLLSQKDYNIKELAEAIGVSSAIMTSHVKKLEDMGIIKSVRNSRKGKVCSIMNSNFTLIFPEYGRDSQYSYELSVPIGHYTAINAVSTCGLADERKVIHAFDDPRSFFDPERINAELIWFSRGFVEYTVPNYVTYPQTIASIEVTAELSSEYPHYRDEWPSDIELYLSDEYVCTWTSPGDFGSNRGKLTPAWWTSNQYGLLKSFRINNRGTYVDEELYSTKTVSDYPLDLNLIKIRFGTSSSNASGGVTIHGKKFGNHPQDINVRIGYNVL